LALRNTGHLQSELIAPVRSSTHIRWHTDKHSTSYLSYLNSPYDPYVPSPTGTGGRQPDGASRAGAGGATGGGNAKVQGIQQEIEATVNIMQDNIRKVNERGARLDTLQEQTGETSAFLALLGGLLRLVMSKDYHKEVSLTVGVSR